MTAKKTHNFLQKGKTNDRITNTFLPIHTCWNLPNPTQNKLFRSKKPKTPTQRQQTLNKNRTRVKEEPDTHKTLRERARGSDTVVEVLQIPVKSSCLAVSFFPVKSACWSPCSIRPPPQRSRIHIPVSQIPQFPGQNSRLS